MAVGAQDLREFEALRGLRAVQAVARNGRPLAAVRSLQCIGHGQKRNRAIAAGFQCGDHAIDHGRRNERTRRIMDEHDIRCRRRKCFEAAPDGFLPCRSSNDGGEQCESGGRLRIDSVLVGSDRDLDRRDLWMAGERLDRPAQNRLAEQRRILLGHRAARPFAPAGGHDQDGNARHGLSQINRNWVARKCHSGRKSSALRRIATMLLPSL